MAGGQIPLERRPGVASSLLDAHRPDAARRATAHLAQPERQDLREARGPEPHRLDQGSRREGDDRDGRGARRARPRSGAARADEREHGHLARDGRQAEGLPAHLRDARERDARERVRLLELFGAKVVFSPGEEGSNGAVRLALAMADARTPATSCRSSTRTRPTRALTTKAPARRSPRHCRGSTRSSRVSAPAAR